jgi:TolA-binding protein
VSNGPVDPPRPRSHEELLAAARQLPEPPLEEARREEMRTEFLATMRELRGGKRSRSLAARGKGKRFLMAASLLFAAGGFAAAAWRITARPPVLAPPVAADQAGAGAHRAAATSGPAEAAGAEPADEAPPPAPSEADGLDRPKTRTHRRLAMRAPGTDTSQVEAESAFARGWAALGAGNFAVAAEAFGDAGGPRGENTLSEDACFWRAVAFDRAGRFGEAQRAFTEFLARYPRSDRAGEASVMLGWLLLRAGSGAAAAARFASALDDPGERVRGSAQAGLAAAVSRHH